MQLGPPFPSTFTFNHLPVIKENKHEHFFQWKMVELHHQTTPNPNEAECAQYSEKEVTYCSKTASVEVHYIRHCTRFYSSSACNKITAKRICKSNSRWKNCKLPLHYNTTIFTLKAKWAQPSGYCISGGTRPWTQIRPSELGHVRKSLEIIGRKEKSPTSFSRKLKTS